MQANPFVGVVGQRDVLRTHAQRHEPEDAVCDGGIMLAVGSSDEQKRSHRHVWENRPAAASRCQNVARKLHTGNLRSLKMVNGSVMGNCCGMLVRWHSERNPIQQ